MKKILTIIIPSYNMEFYLEHCLNSLLVNSIDKMEVLVVNDGSKDKTLEIAQRYSSRYPNSIKVIDKENGNYGSCINAALKEATGKYVKVLDADDSFEKSNVDEFISFLSECEADLVISDYVKVNEEDIVTNTYTFGAGQKQNSFAHHLDELLNPDFQMHAVAYKLSVFENLNYFQTEGVSYTDMEWMFLPMTRVETIVFFNKIVYRYLVGREGQTVNTKVSYKAVDQVMLLMENLLSIYDEKKDSISPNHKKYLEYRLEIKSPSIYRIVLLKSNSKDLYARLSIFDKKLKACYPFLYYEMEKEGIKGIPFKYVNYWRSRYPHRNIKLLTLVSYIIRTILG